MSRPDNHLLSSERVLEDVSPPLTNVLKGDEIWDGKKVKLAALRDHFKGEGRIDIGDAMRICREAGALLKKEPNVLYLQDPITVCGDIHGQYYDLMKLFDIGGDPSTTQYLFLGDYVDRGYFGCECTLYLFAIKINYPDKIYLLRGNHECRHLTSFFNFKTECLYKYNEDLYDTFMKSFDNLSLAAVVNNRFFCVHGGLSPDVRTVQDIIRINRFVEPSSSGAMCDLLWSDPMDEEDEDQHSNVMYLANELRGCSYVYSYNAVCTFLRENSFLSIIRAHEAQDHGYRLYRKTDNNDFPSVICIFSAPNYCDVYNNKGAIIRFQNNLMNIRQFNCSPHPYWLPNFMNAFNWSLPYVAEKVSEMLSHILNVCAGEDDDDSDEEGSVSSSSDTPTPNRSLILRQKVLAVARMSNMFKTMREETDSVVFLKGLFSQQKLPAGVLSAGPRKIREAIKDFNRVKELDRANEARPSDDSAAYNARVVQAVGSVESELKQEVAKVSRRIAAVQGRGASSSSPSRNVVVSAAE